MKKKKNNNNNNNNNLVKMVIREKENDQVDFNSTMYKQKCQLRSPDANRVETELTIAKIHNDHNVDKNKRFRH